MRAIHYAVERVNLDCIFPNPHSLDTSPHSLDTRQIPPQIFSCFKELEKLELSESQKKAVTSMLHPKYKRVSCVVVIFFIISSSLIPFL